MATASMGGSGVGLYDPGTWQPVAQLQHSGQEFYSVILPEGSSLVLAAAGDSQAHIIQNKSNPSACLMGRRGS
eukprot:scaffold369107_cov34-Prasinocladus_malaysianus.AAC.1